MQYRRLLVLLCILLALTLLPHAAVQAQTGSSWIVMARRLSGQDDLWARAVSGPTMGLWLRLTATPESDERWPALSPDGTQLAYTARRDRTWDLYVLDLRTGEERRLTNDTSYEAHPAWAPDGTRLAFASDLPGDLDIFVVDLEGESPPENLTPGSKAQEYEPIWDQAGETLTYVSTRRGVQRLFTLRVGDETAAELPAPEGVGLTAPQWDVEGESLLVWFHEYEGLKAYMGRLDPESGAVERLTWTAAERGRATWSPDGSALAWVDAREDHWILFTQELRTGAMPQRLGGGEGRARDVQWVGTVATAPLTTHAERIDQTTPPAVIPTEAQGPELVTIPDLDTLRPEVNGAVVGAYQGLRARVRGEAGYDYLGRVSETHRPLTFASEDSAFLSWHKSGRAFDTLLDLGVPPSQLRLEVVRDDALNEVFWRIYLQCIPRDGTCGAPLLERPWDFSPEARRDRAPGKGGHPDRFWPGYWLDFTELAEDYGWFRIASYEDPDFDWRTDKTALEFWHYERPDGLTWWQSVQELYAPDALAEIFTWEEYQAREIDLWILRVKGVPLPPEYRTRPVDLVAP